MDIVRLSTETARRITTWRYPPPYDLYNLDDTPSSIVELTGGDYYAAFDASGDLIGYFCFGESARVVCPESNQYYRDGAFIDIGLGLRPDLTGEGRGADFVACGLEFGRRVLAPKRSFRLSVATFNLRAVSVYQRLGFKSIGRRNYPEIRD